MVLSGKEKRLEYMSILIWLQTNLYKLGAVLGVVFAIYLKGRKSGSKSAEKKAIKANKKTEERIDDAIEKSHSGGAAWRDRLRDLD